MSGTLLTPFIYIDACVFQYRQFDVKSPAFAALLEQIKDGHAKLLSSSITTRECHGHIKSLIDETSQVRNTLSAKAQILKNFPEFAVLFEKVDKDDLSNRLIAEFDKFHVEAQAAYLELTSASVTDVFDNYFNGMAPFDTADKKALAVFD